MLIVRDLLRGAATFLSVLLVAAVGLAQESEITIWPAGLPADAKPLSQDTIAAQKEKTDDVRIAYVESPTLTVYQAQAEKANGCAVIVCPGGGYNILAWPKEGLEVAEWFNSIGVTAFVLKYRVPRRDPQRIHWEPMQDVQRAIRIIRARADEWEIAPDRIGVLGFSAGGHLTVMAGVQYSTRSYPKIDEIDDLSCRPDFICPIYAAYLGNGYRDDVVELGDLVSITKETPPAFMAVTWDDRMRGAQAALMFAELKKHAVPSELHVYTKGGHGYGIRTSDFPVSRWNKDLEAWLKSMDFLNER